MNYEKIAEILFQELRSINSASLIEVLNEFNRGEIGVLNYLVFDKDEVSAGELSEKLNVSTARIASILNSLENKEYIKRKEDNLDKRKTLVIVTTKGKDLVTSAKKEIINKIKKVIEEVGYDEIRDYLKTALKIRNVLNKQ
ncbi:MAG: MarR family winged helix-turn-helix transcriptional regulator [Bacilli bacterium]